MTDIGLMVRSANPVPDDSQQLTDDELSAVLLLAQQRSGDMDVKERTEPVPSVRPSRPGWLIAALAFGAIIVVVGAAMLLTRETTTELPPATTPPTTQALPTTTVAPEEQAVASVEEPAEPVDTVSTADLATIKAYEDAINSGDTEQIRAFFGPAFRATDQSTIGQGWFSTADMWTNEQAYYAREGATVTYTECALDDGKVTCLETWSGPRMSAMLGQPWTYRMEFTLGDAGVIESLHGRALIWPDQFTEQRVDEAMIAWAIQQVDADVAANLAGCGPGTTGEGFANIEGAALCGEWLQRWLEAGRP